MARQPSNRPCDWMPGWRPTPAATVIFTFTMVYAGLMDLTTMRIRNGLVFALLAAFAVLTTLGGTLMSRLAATRAVAPLESVAAAAAQIAAGQMDTRLAATDDPVVWLRGTGPVAATLTAATLRAMAGARTVTLAVC